MRPFPCLVACLLCVITLAQTDGRVVLWDFTEGIDGWWANPWSGGKASVAPGEGKYGPGLVAAWEDVPGSGNIVSPFLPEDAAWREWGCTIISFWLKGDGTQTNLNLQVLCEGPDGGELGYSRRVPIDNADWQRHSLDMRTFWNREKVAFNPAKIRRILFVGTGTRSVGIDHVALESPRIPVALEREDASGPVQIDPSLARGPAGMLVTFDAGQVGRAATAKAEIQWTGGKVTRGEQMIADPPQDDGLIAVPIPESSAGPAQLTLTLKTPDATLHESTYAFQAAGSIDAPEPHLDLLPSPKQFVTVDGPPLRLSGTLTVRAFGPADQVDPVREYLVEQLEARCGISCETPALEEGSGAPRLFVTPGGGAPATDIPWEELRGHGPEAYWLDCAGRGVTIAAPARQGLRYGAITLLQLAVDAAGSEAHELAPCRIMDWPTLAVRAISIPLPTDRWGHPNDAPVAPDFWEQFLLRTCLEHKLNTVVILVWQGMKYNRHPEIDGPAAWDQDTVRRIVRTLKAHDINPIPLLDSLGHANWLVIPIKRLREDGDTHTLCTRHPDAKRVLLDCYEEVIDVFQPTHFHMGLDEIRWQTFNKPEEERCPICRGVDKREIFVEQVTMLCDFLRERNIRPMMWGDMVLKQHNGGPPFHLDDTLDQLPKGIIITNWSTTLDPLSSHLFRTHGFEVIQSNSRGVTPAQAPGLLGNMFGVWNKLPWVTELATGPGRGLNYSFLPILTAAEYSWNLYPDAMAVGVRTAPEFFEEREPALGRLALQAPVGTLEAIDVPDAPLALEAGAEISIPVGRKAAGLVLVAAADVPEDQTDAFYKRLQDKTTWKGLPIAEFVIRYEDGTEATRPLSFGFDVRDSVNEDFPYCYNAIRSFADDAGRTWYALHWVNPSPEKEIGALVFRHGGTEATALLREVSVDMGKGGGQ